MIVRWIRFSLPVIAAVVVCGCNSESPYNIPLDESKDAAAIGAGTPQRRVSAGKKKINKPPGVPLKDAKSLQPHE